MNRANKCDANTFWCQTQRSPLHSVALQAIKKSLQSAAAHTTRTSHVAPLRIAHNRPIAFPNRPLARLVGLLGVRLDDLMLGQRGGHKARGQIGLQPGPILMNFGAITIGGPEKRLNSVANLPMSFLLL